MKFLVGVQLMFAQQQTPGQNDRPKTPGEHSQRVYIAALTDSTAFD